MALCDYEKNILKKIHYGTMDNTDPGAAVWAAIESLAGNGYIHKGKATAKGMAALSGMNT